MGLNRYNILEPCFRYPSVAEGNQSASSTPNFRKEGADDMKHITNMYGGRHFVRSSGRDGRVPMDAQLEPTFHVPCIVSDFKYDELSLPNNIISIPN